MIKRTGAGEDVATCIPDLDMNFVFCAEIVCEVGCLVQVRERATKAHPEYKQVSIS